MLGVLQAIHLGNVLLVGHIVLGRFSLHSWLKGSVWENFISYMKCSGGAMLSLFSTVMTIYMINLCSWRSFVGLNIYWWYNSSLHSYVCSPWVIISLSSHLGCCSCSSFLSCTCLNTSGTTAKTGRSRAAWMFLGRSRRVKNVLV